MSVSLPALTVRSGQRSSSARKVRPPSRSMRSLTTDSAPRPGLRIATKLPWAVGRGLVGVDPDVVVRPCARGHGVLGDAHDEHLAAEHRPRCGSPPRRRGRARGSRNGVWGGCHTPPPARPAHSGSSQMAFSGVASLPGASRRVASRPKERPGASARAARFHPASRDGSICRPSIAFSARRYPAANSNSGWQRGAAERFHRPCPPTLGPETRRPRPISAIRIARGRDRASGAYAYRAAARQDRSCRVRHSPSKIRRDTTWRKPRCAHSLLQ